MLKNKNKSTETGYEEWWLKVKKNDDNSNGCNLQVIHESLEIVMMEEWVYLKLMRIEVRRRAHMIRREGNERQWKDERLNPKN